MAALLFLLLPLLVAPSYARPSVRGVTPISLEIAELEAPPQPNTTALLRLERLEPATLLSLATLGWSVTTYSVSLWARNKLRQAKMEAQAVVLNHLQDVKQFMLGLQKPLEAMLESYRAFVESEADQSKLGAVIMVAAVGANQALDAIQNFLGALDGETPTFAIVGPGSWNHKYNKVDAQSRQTWADALTALQIAVSAAGVFAGIGGNSRTADVLQSLSEYGVFSINTDFVSGVVSMVEDKLLQPLQQALLPAMHSILGTGGLMVVGGAVVGLTLATTISSFASEMQQWHKDMQWVASNAMESKQDLDYMLCKTLVPVFGSNLQFAGVIEEMKQTASPALDRAADRYQAEMCKQQPPPQLCAQLAGAGGAVAKLDAIVAEHKHSNSQISEMCRHYWMEAEGFEWPTPVSNLGFLYQKFPGKCLEEGWPTDDGKKRSTSAGFLELPGSRDIFLSAGELPAAWKKEFSENGLSFGVPPYMPQHMADLGHKADFGIEGALTRSGDCLWCAMNPQSGCPAAQSQKAADTIANRDTSTGKRQQLKPAASPICMQPKEKKTDKDEVVSYSDAAGKMLVLETSGVQQYVTAVKAVEWGYATVEPWDLSNFWGTHEQYTQKLQDSRFLAVQSLQYPFNLSDKLDQVLQAEYIWNRDRFGHMAGANGGFEPWPRWLTALNDGCLDQGDYDKANQKSIHLFQHVVKGDLKTSLAPPVVDVGTITKGTWWGYYNDDSTQKGKQCLDQIKEKAPLRTCFVNEHLNLIKGAPGSWKSHLWVEKDYRIPVPTSFLFQGVWPTLVEAA